MYTDSGFTEYNIWITYLQCESPIKSIHHKSHNDMHGQTFAISSSLKIILFYVFCAVMMADETRKS